MSLTFVWVVFILFIAATSVQLFFWFFVFSRLAFFPIKTKKRVSDSELPPVSVVVCARNEADNLRYHLPHILSQDYPNFEVVVVNDASTDDTRQVLHTLQTQNSRLRVVDIAEKTVRGKKNALTRGIEAAQNDWLLLTDADCMPNSAHWISGMMSEADSNTDIILGVAPLSSGDADSGFVNRFARFEAAYTAIQYISFALWRKPYMGVGRNIAYRKSTWQKVGGFRKHADVASGDDDLFVNEAITEKNYKFFLEPFAHTYSEPKNTWNTYFLQKKRHISVGNRYKMADLIRLGLLSMSHFGHYILAIMLLILKFSTIFVLAILGCRLLVVWYFYARVLKRLQILKLFWFVPFLDVFYIFFYVVFLPALFAKTPRWK